jgi:hypothetical protein
MTSFRKKKKGSRDGVMRYRNNTKGSVLTAAMARQGIVRYGTGCRRCGCWWIPWCGCVLPANTPLTQSPASADQRVDPSLLHGQREAKAGSHLTCSSKHGHAPVYSFSFSFLPGPPAKMRTDNPTYHNLSYPTLPLCLSLCLPACYLSSDLLRAACRRYLA